MRTLPYSDFLRASDRILRDSAANGRYCAALVVDFEGMAVLDGVLGYAAVDRIISHAASRLVEALQPTDLVGMTGRHQLSCLLGDAQGEGYAVLAAHKVLRVLAPPIVQAQRHIALSPRIGVALSESSESGADHLLRNANSAMHQARRHREPVGTFERNSDETLLLGIDIWSDLNSAIEEGGLFMVHQPQLALATGRIEGTEALLRWNHPQRGPIGPAVMVQVAEGTGLMSRLTLWVLNIALRQCAEYRKAGLQAGISINFSADDIRDPEIVDLVAQGLDLWGVPASEIIIELTETAVMEGHPGALEALWQFKDMGLRLSMDDFGTGYSSMARLLLLPLDEIKIDMSFIRDMTKSRAHERIVDSMIGLGHKQGLTVVAEGVEDTATLELLRTMGCDMVQGYLVGRPMQLPELIRSFATTSADCVGQHRKGHRPW
jgi:EAL domain-containing protein (putative c-di-GMP-specific phosphodiesterase class I)/GGDEF domain-containing protein